MTSICPCTSVTWCPIALKVERAYLLQTNRTTVKWRHAFKNKERKAIVEKGQTKKLYRTVMADPPWDIEQGGARGAINHYNLMKLEHIKAMPIADLVDKNAHCWLWVTNAALKHGYDVLEAWGFTPRSVFCWIKPRLGLGNYLRNASEHVLFGSRGKAPVLYHSQPNWMFAPVQDHSHKPEEQYAIIERVSPGPYLELFARRHQSGWDAWGNEIDSDIVLPGYPVPQYRKEG